MRLTVEATAELVTVAGVLLRVWRATTVKGSPLFMLEPSPGTGRPVGRAEVGSGDVRDVGAEGCRYPVRRWLAMWWEAGDEALKDERPSELLFAAACVREADAETCEAFEKLDAARPDALMNRATALDKLAVESTFAKLDSVGVA